MSSNPEPVINFPRTYDHKEKLFKMLPSPKSVRPDFMYVIHTNTNKLYIKESALLNKKCN